MSKPTPAEIERAVFDADQDDDGTVNLRWYAADNSSVVSMHALPENRVMVVLTRREGNPTTFFKGSVAEFVSLLSERKALVEENEASMAEIATLRGELEALVEDPSEAQTPSERHNAATLPVLRLIVKLVGGDPIDLLIFAESLVVGLFLLIVKMGGDEPVLSIFAEGLSERLAEQRLGPVEPEGEG